MLKYIECKAKAYNQMNGIRKEAAYLRTLSEIYHALPQIQRYAVAVDTLDYMFDNDGFVYWHFSDYAQITISALHDLFTVVVADIDEIEAIRIVYAVERAIVASRWLLKDAVEAEAELDFATMRALDEIQLKYRELRPTFIQVMKQWFESQV